MSKAYRPNLNDPYLMAEIARQDKELGKSLYDVKEVFSEEGGDNKHVTSLEILKQDRVFRAATHMLRFHAKAYDKLLRSVGQAITDVTGSPTHVEALFDGKPLMIPGKTPEEIVVFVNLPLNDPKYDEIMKCSWVTFPELLKSFWWKYQDDIGDDSKKKAWDGFKDRGLKKIWKSDHLTVERALTRWTKMADSYSAAQIRDIAIAYVETLKPVEITFTKTPQDFLTMYSTGPESCMALTKGERTALWQVLIDAGLHPASFYGYSPHCKGAYILRGKNILARAVCFENIKTPGKWEYGRLYSSSPKYNTQLINGLKDLGIEALNHQAGDLKGTFWEKKYTFEIPGVPTKDNKNLYAMPMPYLDNHSRNLNVTFDNKRKVFIINVNSGMATNVPGDQTAGYVLSNRLEHIACESCDVQVLSSKAIQTLDGEHAYCSASCAYADKYVSAYRSDGQQVWILEEDSVLDAYGNVKGNGHKYAYTNVEAALALGAFPYASSLDELPEDGSEKYTQFKGMPIKYNNVFYRLDEHEFNRLAADGLIDATKLRVQQYDIRTIKSGAEVTKMNQEIDIKTQKVVLLEDNWSPISDTEIAQLLAV